MHVTRDVVLPVSSAEAWELITDPDELALWLGTERRIVVDEVVEGRRVGFVWWADDDPEQASRVELVVEEAEGGSRVTVTETAPVRASVAGGVRRLAIGSGWDGRLVDLELRALTRFPVLV